MLIKGPKLPPRSLIALIIAITVVPLATLLWLGWRLLDQDRILEDKQAHEHVEHAADLLVATFQHRLASDAQRLAAGAEDWPEGAVAITIREDRVEASPRNRVAYLPMVPALPEAPDAVFAEGEKLELQQDYSSAIEVFRALAESPEPAVRAGGILGLGRSLEASGHIEDALAVYNRLDSLDSVAIPRSGTPAGLIGRYMRCDLLAKQKRSAELQREVRRLAGELASGRWALTKSLYELYTTRSIPQWSGAESAGTREPEVFAEAADTFWEQRRFLSPSGNKPIAVGDQHLFAIWQGSEGSIRVLLASPEYSASHWLAAAATLAKEQHVSFRIDGGASNDTGASAKRTAKETDLPWNLVVTSSGVVAQAGDFELRRRLLIAGFLLLAGMALAANYLIIRAVRHERAVARLQTDFVAAVSHEFRTPLTALRQFTDMLREHEGAAPEQGKDRRLICYEAQSRATNRLTRLVESLLDFGRMEAGVRRYSFERRDCSEFVSQVVQDFRNPAEAAGHRVEFSGNGSSSIEADGESLSRAIWNLLDNAVKYSPSRDAIEVGLHRHGGDVRIDVRDFGIGIPAYERSAIFSKFQRGEQARIRGIKGTGIGLTMVDEIVRAHHGRVEVKSEPGKGSTFTIVLPVKD